MLLYSENLDSVLSCFVSIRITLTVEQWIVVQGHSRSRTRLLLQRKPICDFSLVINCYLNAISHVSEIQQYKVENHPTAVWPPDQEDLLWISLSNLSCESSDFVPVLCENRVILTSVFLSQYIRITDDRQTTYHDSSRIRSAKNGIYWLFDFVLLQPSSWKYTRISIGQ